MKTLIFNGSPRINGDTESLIKIITENLNGEYKIVNAYQCAISPCMDCRYCWENAGCRPIFVQDSFEKRPLLKRIKKVRLCWWAVVTEG